MALLYKGGREGGEERERERERERCIFVVYMYNMYNPVMETRQIQAMTPEDNSFFSKRKEELPRAGLEPATFCFPGRPLYQLTTCTCILALHSRDGMPACSREK